MTASVHCIAACQEAIALKQNMVINQEGKSIDKKYTYKNHEETSNWEQRILLEEENNPLVNITLWSKQEPFPFICFLEALKNVFIIPFYLSCSSLQN